MLRKMRVAISAAICIAAVAAITTSAIGIGIAEGWIQKIQIVQLLLAGGIPWIIGWMIITFVFGRIYCSSVCPLGTFQDCVNRVASCVMKKQKFHYVAPVWSIRWLFLLVMILAITCLSLTLTLALDPYSSFKRIITGVAVPAFTLGAVKVSLTVAAASLTTLIIVMSLSAFHGRRLCNTLCPVGTGLGLLSISPVYRIDINTDKCIGCNRCVEVCKSSCIDPGSHTVDTTRCVVCFNCTAVCNNNAITYTSNRHKLKHPMLMENR